MKYLISGESHGKQLTGIIEGLPAGFSISIDKINEELNRRQQGYGRGRRMQIENDKVEIVSGMRYGKTIASPLTLVIKNKDYDNWVEKMDLYKDNKKGVPLSVPRPGHADLGGILKYNLNDVRDVLERASARDTAMRVGIGAICKQYLEMLDINVYSHVVQIGRVEVSNYNLDEIKNADKSVVRCVSEQSTIEICKLIDDCKSNGDTLGGVVEVVVTNLPPGIGSYVHWDKKLDAKIAGSVMSVQSVKGVEFGKGFEIGKFTGKEVHDVIFYNKEFKRRTNNYGGIEGGMSTGMPVVVRAGIKPIPTLMSPLETVDINTKETVYSHKERSDVCAVPAASIVLENVIATTILKELVHEFSSNTSEDLLYSFNKYKERIKKL